MYFFENLYDYSKTVDFNDFIHPNFLNDGHSKIYGKYEYFCFDDDRVRSELFAHTFKKYKWNDTVKVTNRYIDDYGNEYFKEDYALEKSYVIIYRRDLESLDDEILRFAHYSKYVVYAIFGRMRQDIRNSRNSGIALPPDYKKDYDAFEQRHIRNKAFVNSDKKAILAAKRYADAMVDKYNLPTFTYDFASSIVGPEESKAKDVYERERMHLDYLEQCLTGKVKGYHPDQSKVTYAENKRKTYRVFFTLFMISLFSGVLAMIYGSVLSGPEQKEIAGMIGMLGYVLIAAAIVFFILFLVNKRKAKH